MHTFQIKVIRMGEGGVDSFLRELWGAQVMSGKH